MKMKVKKLAPSRNPTAFEPATVLSRNSRSGSSGASTLVSMTRKADEQGGGAGEHGHGLGGRPADLRRLRDGVDEGDRPPVTVMAPKGS